MDPQNPTSSGDWLAAGSVWKRDGERCPEAEWDGARTCWKCWSSPSSVEEREGCVENDG